METEHFWVFLLALYKNDMIHVVASGYFDPLHVGHIDYLQKAKSLGDFLTVIVNNDHQSNLKKGKSFMCENDRLLIVSELKCVDQVILAIDEDSTCCATLEMINPHIFAKGGDRNSKNCPEHEVCKQLNIKFVENLGEKNRSSRDFYNQNPQEK
jgi:cytidyltransferase-like protein